MYKKYHGYCYEDIASDKMTELARKLEANGITVDEDIETNIFNIVEATLDQTAEPKLDDLTRKEIRLAITLDCIKESDVVHYYNNTQWDD